MSTTMATPNGETSSKLPWTTCVMGCDINETSEVTLLKCFHALCSDSCVENFKSGLGRGQNVTTCELCKSPEHAFKYSKKIVLAKFFPKKKIMMNQLRCGNCVSIPLAKAFCNQCDNFLCKGCAKFHSKIELTQNHVLEYENLEDHRREICELEKHGRRPLLFYCHKCDTKFCKICASDHVGHVAFVFQCERQDFDSKMIEAKNFLEECNKAIEGLEANHHRLTADDCMVAKPHLARKCATLFNNWQEECEQREPDLKQVFDAMCTNILVKIKSVKKARQFYQDFLVVGSDISENGDDVAVVNFLRFCGKPYGGSIGDSWILNVNKHSQGMEGVLETDCKLMQNEIAKFNAEVEKITQQPKKPLEVEVSNHSNCGNDEAQVPEDEVKLDQNKMGNYKIRRQPERSCGFKANPDMVYYPQLGRNVDLATGTMSTNKVVQKSSNGKVKLSKKVHKGIKNVKSQNEMESVAANGSGSGTKRPLMAPTDPDESEVDIATSFNTSKIIRRESKQAIKNANIAAEFESAAESSLEDAPSDSDYPLQLPEKMKLSGDLDDGESEDYCCICRDGRDEDDEDDIIICCDFCPKVYHPRCHIPVITEIPKDEEQWRCNYEITKESFEELIAQCNGQNNGDNENIENQVFELVELNKSHFQLACSFLMECHKIPEIPTVRWRFPQKYLEKYGKVPFHLNYIRKRLCLGEPKPFSSTEDMLKAFRQMFIQAFMIYTKKQKFRPEAFKCFTRFLSIINDYYPQYKTMFSGILDN